jgi:proteasome lid subunit RPN8/RPN11
MRFFSIHRFALASPRARNDESEQEEEPMHATQAGPATYRHRLEFWDDEGQRLHELALAPADFTRAVQTACFDGLRRGVFARYDPPLGLARLEPRFAEEAGSPRTCGFRVSLPAGAADHYLDFGIGFFRSQARRTCAELLRAERVREGTRLVYHLTAYQDEEDEAPPSGPRLTLEPAEAEVPIRPGRRRALGPAEAWDEPRANDPSVLIPRRILEVAVEQARATPEQEVGGVLLGHLRRDTDDGEVFIHATCLVPAEETVATGTSVTFTAATWDRARDVVALRGQGEIFVGWAHSHPFRFCAECPRPAPADCIAKVLFFSIDDEFLMELSFPQPFMIGLLTAVEPRLEEALGHLPVRLYGWRHGEIHARGFHVLDDREEQL